MFYLDKLYGESAIKLHRVICHSEQLSLHSEWYHFIVSHGLANTSIDV